MRRLLAIVDAHDCDLCAKRARYRIDAPEGTWYLCRRCLVRTLRGQTFARYVGDSAA